MIRTSLLSSLLVRDGHLEASRMEHVFQRQVIDGGALDTILLEMELIEDHRLNYYLSLASGLPQADKYVFQELARSGKGKKQKLATSCTKEVSTKFCVVPVCLQKDILKVLVCDPVEMEQLESLAVQLNLRIQPVVVPEYLYHVQFSAIYNQEEEKRFAKLAKMLEAESSCKEIKNKIKVPKIVIGSSGELEKEDAKGSKNLMESVLLDEPVGQTMAPEMTEPVDTSERVRGKRAPEEKPARGGTKEIAIVDAVVEAEMTDQRVSRSKSDTLVESQPSSLMEPAKVTPTGAKERVRTTMDGSSLDGSSLDGSSLDASSLPVEHSVLKKIEKVPMNAIRVDLARTLLENSEGRDEIFTILMRAIHERAEYVSLFMVKGDTATGRLALSRNGLEQEHIKQVRIPLTPVSRFATILDTKTFSVGPFHTEDGAIRSALNSLGGGKVPVAAFLLPILMKDRVIAFIVAHSRGKEISVAHFTEFLPLGVTTSEAISRLIAKMRQKKSSTATSKKKEVTKDSAVSKNNHQDPGESSASVPIVEENMIELFSRIESDDPKVSSVAFLEALEQKEKVVAHLYFAFPGKLLKERSVNGTRLKAGEHGPVLKLAIQLGQNCSPALSEKMRAADPEIRYFATLCAAEILPTDVVNEIVERLFDRDNCIRSLAMDALSKYSQEERSQGLDFVRRALHSEDNGRVKLASEALTGLREVKAIPDLIDAHSRGGDAAEFSGRALLKITSQDFANSTSKWRSWWENNQHRNPIEWMLEGLGHKNIDIRKNAVESLREITQEYFAYGHDLPKKQREKTQKQWLKWWDEKGSMRFRSYP